MSSMRLSIPKSVKVIVVAITFKTSVDEPTRIANSNRRHNVAEKLSIVAETRQPGMRLVDGWNRGQTKVAGPYESLAALLNVIEKQAD
jgi:hypothetical protein